jgi:hypothetical protein
MTVRPSTFATRAEYVARLDDVAFWTPYLAEVARRHELPPMAPEVGLVGTFPTFLMGDYVVKCFTRRFDGAPPGPRRTARSPHPGRPRPTGRHPRLGDAVYADPVYDLPSLMFGTFGRPKTRLPRWRTWLISCGR